MGTGRTLIASLAFGWLLPLLLAMAGAVIGSFAGAAAIRIERGASVVTGRSRCDACERTLSVPDLVPVLSFIALRGRCRTCRSRIDPVQPFAEIAGAGIGIASWLAMYSQVQVLLAAILGWQLLVLALTDWRAFHLPPVGIGVLAISAALLPMLDFAAGGAAQVLFLNQLAGGALGYVLLAAPALVFRYMRGRDGMGAADPPLMGAVGLWAGPVGVCFIILLAAVLGIGLALLSSLRAKWASETAERDLTDDFSRDSDGNTEGALPLGTMISVATMVMTFAGFSLLTP